MAEWARYVASLGRDDLQRKARAINAIDVVDRLLEDGLAADEVETVYVFVARRMKELGVRPPDGGLYDWRELATRTPVVASEAYAPRETGETREASEASKTRETREASETEDELADFLRD